MKKIPLLIFTAKNIISSTGSTNTVLNLLDNIDSHTYSIQIITIDAFVPRTMRLPQQQLTQDPSYVPFEAIEKHKSVDNIYDISSLTLSQLRKMGEFAIIAIYNTFGEDGRLIGLLDCIGMPYLSPSVKTSALCFDKQMTKSLLKGSGIPVVNGIEMHKLDCNLTKLHQKIQNELAYPVIVKTTSSGASRGVSVVSAEKELGSAIKKAFNYSDECVVESFLKGREFSIGVYGHYLNPVTLPIVEIKTENVFFDFEAKYTVGKSEEICPANISVDLQSRIKDIAIKAYKAVKATSHSRIDIIAVNNALFVLEINSFPGLTRSSIFPKELLVAGKSLSSFLDRSIISAIKKNNKY